MTTIELPYGYRPREYQQALWNYLEGDGSAEGSHRKRAVAVWHRRAGKDMFAINFTAPQCFHRVGLYWHILPTYKQARKVVWEGRDGTGRRFLEAFGPNAPEPGPLVTRARDDEMSLWLANGSLWQAIGAEDPDRLVGANPVGIVFSEWSVMNPQVWNFLRPILAENGGWALFIYTPRGRNHGHRMLETARANPNWFAQVLGWQNTHALTQDVIDEERESGMSESLIAQEYDCSFDAPLEGAYFTDQMNDAEEHARILAVPWDPNHPVDTGWDLGHTDSTVIWFSQQVGGQVRLIDCYANSLKGMSHYAKVLQNKPYVYGNHYVPHDAKVTELGTGKTRVQSLAKLGIRAKVIPKVSIQDRIDATRAFLMRCIFDRDQCDMGIEALKQYRKKKASDDLVGPDGESLYIDEPVKDWTTHYADALGYLALGLRPPRSFEERKKLAPDLAIV